LAHSLYKGALFMVAGIIDHETGSKDLRNTGGLFRAMPITAIAAGIAALSLAGVIPMFGFVAKELLFDAGLQDAATWILASLLAGPLVLALLGLGFGIAAPWVDHILLGAAATAVAGVPVEYPISLWHGFNTPLLLSIISLIAGVLLYRWRHHFRHHTRFTDTL